MPDDNLYFGFVNDYSQCTLHELMGYTYLVVAKPSSVSDAVGLALVRRVTSSAVFDKNVIRWRSNWPDVSCSFPLLSAPCLTCSHPREGGVGYSSATRTTSKRDFYIQRTPSFVNFCNVQLVLLHGSALWNAIIHSCMCKNVHVSMPRVSTQSQNHPVSGKNTPS